VLQFATMAPGCGIGGPNSIPAVSARSNARQIGTSQPTIRPDLLDLKADGATLTGSMTHQGFIGIRGATPACGSREIRSISIAVQDDLEPS